ncbi:MAG: hypothetical protein ACQEVA_23085 [Myxococcota bacterium]
MERVIRPGVFILAAVIWGLLFVGETLLCTGDETENPQLERSAPVSEPTTDDARSGSSTP